MLSAPQLLVAHVVGFEDILSLAAQTGAVRCWVVEGSVAQCIVLDALLLTELTTSHHQCVWVQEGYWEIPVLYIIEGTHFHKQQLIKTIKTLL